MSIFSGMEDLSADCLWTAAGRSPDRKTDAKQTKQKIIFWNKWIGYFPV